MSSDGKITSTNVKALNREMEIKKIQDKDGLRREARPKSNVGRPRKVQQNDTPPTEPNIYDRISGYFTGEPKKKDNINDKIVLCRKIERYTECFGSTKLLRYKFRALNVNNTTAELQQELDDIKNHIGLNISTLKQAENYLQWGVSVFAKIEREFGNPWNADFTGIEKIVSNTEEGLPPDEQPIKYFEDELKEVTINHPELFYSDYKTRLVVKLFEKSYMVAKKNENSKDLAENYSNL